ncbi:MAG: DegV family protein [Anaerolineae bacterium]|jgi:DegV family protein with EDD domain|nr:DegV family protein [Anaerolineae bacterium]
MVRIIADTTSCVAESFAAAHDIPIIPQVIIFGDESFLEGVEITQEVFIERLRAATKPPKTAAPPPDLFTEAFMRLAPAGEPILCILPSSLVSGTVRSATVGLRMAREQGLDGLDVRIIDTKLIASPVATLIRLALQWAKQGEPIDVIEARILEMSARCRIYFVVDTLKYLAMGGRIGGAAALLGGVLQVKPVLTFIEGQVETFEKVRTHQRAIERLRQVVLEQIGPGDRGYLQVMHADALEEAEELAAFFCTRLGLAEVPIRSAPPAIVTHGGPGVLGVGFFQE